MPLLGFLGKPAPSRKQWDWYRDRQGPQKRLENPVTIVRSTDITVLAGPNSTTLYTPPSGYRARLLFFQVIVDNTAIINTWTLTVDGQRLIYWDSGFVSPEVSQRYTIDDGPQFFSALKLESTAGAPTANAILVSLVVNIEPAADGEYVTV